MSEFYGSKVSKDGFMWRCKKCIKEFSADYRKNNPEKIKEYNKIGYINNSEKIKERAKQWKVDNPTKAKERDKKWRQNNLKKIKIDYNRTYQANKEKYNAKNYEWKINNPDKVKEASRKYQTKIKSTASGRINSRLSNSIWHSLRANKAGKHWEDLVHFTIDELKNHLEKKFKPGMTWELFLQGKIHIDHIIPLSVHNFETYNDLDFQKAWSLKNLQPMWAKENLIKSNKLSKPFQPSLAI